MKQKKKKTTTKSTEFDKQRERGKEGKEKKMVGCNEV